MTRQQSDVAPVWRGRHRSAFRAFGMISGALGAESTDEMCAKASHWPGPRDGALRATIAAEVVRLYAAYSGRGPTRARTHLGPDHALTLLEDFLTPAERTLTAAGHGAEVQRMRLKLQDALRLELMPMVERVTGRRVTAVLSQTQVEPELASELFLLAPEGADAAGTDGRAPAA
jgi:uncharacterized protein YbcI